MVQLYDWPKFLISIYNRKFDLIDVSKCEFCLKRIAADEIYKKKRQKGAEFVELWRVS